VNEIVRRLVDGGVMSAEAADRVRELTAEGKPLDDALRSADGVSEEKLVRFLADEFQIPYVDLENAAPEREFLLKFPARILLEHKLLPLEERDGVAVIATSKLFDTAGLDELRVATGMEFTTALAPSAEVDRAIKRVLGVGADTLQSMGDELQVINEEDDDDLDLSKAAEDASIIRFVNQIMTEALESRATDVHFEPFENQLRIRYRIDGVLVEANIPAHIKRFQPAIISRIKILSHLDIAEKRLPQDGRIKLKVAGREIDIRVSVIPMIHGEAVVLRILDRGEAMLGTEHLGMNPRDARVFDKVLELPHGICLVTGPTGSGKTTTLYAGLSKINTVDQKIITIEDPVEYQLRGVNQIQVNAKTGLTFAAGLRSILRHDPDVVLVGEIRDKETADIAIQASLTGHLVFSTLHTNDAPTAATRLIDMGVEPYLVASSVEMVLAQRLVRLVCKHCKEMVPTPDYDVLRREFGDVVPEQMAKGKGCRNCQNTGYRGRQGVFEMMPISEEIRELIIERTSSQAVRRVAVEQGMKSLREDGWRLIREGKTTVEEVMRLTKDEAAGASTRAAAMAGAGH